jgi:hypothetical protein
VNVKPEAVGVLKLAPPVIVPPAATIMMSFGLLVVSVTEPEVSLEKKLEFEPSIAKPAACTFPVVFRTVTRDMTAMNIVKAACFRKTMP